MAEPSSKRQKISADPKNAPRVTDPRFTNIQSDPRYRLPGKRNKVKLDKRFARAIQDDDFARKAKVDRYGRPVETDAERQRLKRKYEFEDDEQSEEIDDDEDVQSELQRVEIVRDPLRDGKDVSSSEEESSSDEDSEVEEDAVDEAGPGLQTDDVIMGDVSARIAVVNLDWDNIRAEDLMAVFSSFLPATGRLTKVSIYPSEFGKERMEREEMEGPPKEIFTARNDDDFSDLGSEEEDDDDIKARIIKPDDGSEFDSAALRQYQLERLRYFYAVLTFSSPEAAKAIYDAVDGTEYLSTANFFDLRFVPDDTDFDNDQPREECERLTQGYKPNEFVTDALQHSKVKLTWDAEDTGRKEAAARAFKGGRKEIDENDLKAYLGSDSSDNEEEETDIVQSLSNVEGEKATGDSKKQSERRKMRALLGLAPEPVKKSKQSKEGPVGDMQITFSSGLGPADQEKKRSVFENSPEPDETTMEKYVRKEKERKQKRKERIKAGREGVDINANVSNVIDETGEKEVDLGFDDPFFTEPLDDKKGAQKIRKEDRLKKKAEREAEEAVNAKQRAALEALMADDNKSEDEKAGKGRTVKHFDMKEIEKAEKLAKKGKKRHDKKSKRDAEQVANVRDDFQLDTTDPRFARLFENHEYAIDPTNPKFKDTKNMNILLEEGRKRKSHKHGRGEDKKGRVKTNSVGDNDVQNLVEKIKRRTKT